MPGVATTTPFYLPPVVRTREGPVRRLGVEMEFSGLSIQQAASIVRKVFGGSHVVRSTFRHQVRTEQGEFNIEIDAPALKQKAYEPVLRRLGLKPQKLADAQRLEEALLGIAATVVPIEISAPPMPVTDLEPLEALRRRLCKRGAEGTRRSILYAFGLHLNPQIPDEDPALLLNHLRAFLLLYPWLKQQSQVDGTRTMVPFIYPFPAEYVHLVLDPQYPASLDRLIDDYVKYNPTRYRPLDMLPLLVWLDEQRVIPRLGQRHTMHLSRRPTFHYRLPNCLVDEPHWTLAEEWNRWIAVERLAHDPQQIRRMTRAFAISDAESFKPFFDTWPDIVQRYMTSDK